MQKQKEKSRKDFFDYIFLVFFVIKFFRVQKNVNKPNSQNITAKKSGKKKSHQKPKKSNAQKHTAQKSKGLKVLILLMVKGWGNWNTQTEQLNRAGHGQGVAA